MYVGTRNIRYGTRAQAYRTLLGGGAVAWGREGIELVVVENI